MYVQRSDFVRPITVAITFTLFGETLIFLIWGVLLFPGGNLWHKAIWTGTCGIAMGATIGGLVNVLVVGRLAGKKAAICSGAVYVAVLALCTLLCYRLDLALGSHFGAQKAPLLFLLGGLLPAFVSGVFYAWLLFSEEGGRLLSRFGY